jgi:hypothetical protein
MHAELDEVSAAWFGDGAEVAAERGYVWDLAYPVESPAECQVRFEQRPEGVEDGFGCVTRCFRVCAGDPHVDVAGDGVVIQHLPGAKTVPCSRDSGLSLPSIRRGFGGADYEHAGRQDGRLAVDNSDGLPADRGSGDGCCCRSNEVVRDWPD